MLISTINKKINNLAIRFANNQLTNKEEKREIYKNYSSFIWIKARKKRCSLSIIGGNAQTLHHNQSLHTFKFYKHCSISYPIKIGL
jgi:hypothetical protein